MPLIPAAGGRSICATRHSELGAIRTLYIQRSRRSNHRPPSRLLSKRLRKGPIVVDELGNGCSVGRQREIPEGQYAGTSSKNRTYVRYGGAIGRTSIQRPDGRDARTIGSNLGLQDVYSFTVACRPGAFPRTDSMADYRTLPGDGYGPIREGLIASAGRTGNHLRTEACCC